MHREKKSLSLQTGGCPLPADSVSSSSRVDERQQTSSGCCHEAACNVQMATSEHLPACSLAIASKCLHKSTTNCSSSTCPSKQPKQLPSTPPPVISPSRALAGNGFSGPTPPRLLYGLGNGPQGNSPYLPLHTVPYSSIGVASPPSPRCYDIIEEEMIFPMSDITEEDEVYSPFSLLFHFHIQFDLQRCSTLGFVRCTFYITH